MKHASPFDEIKAAFHADDAPTVRRLLSAHADLKAMVNEPLGPFDSPAIVNARSREMLDALLDVGADINAKSTWWAGGFGLLHSADSALAEYAISRGASVDIHAAARLGKFDLLREHIARDPESVHSRGGDGQTPLHFASTAEIAAYLLDHGADIDATDLDHESTPAQWMIDDRQEIVRFLAARGCKTDILMAAALGDVALIRRILDSNPESIRMRVSSEYFPMIGEKAGGTIYQWKLGWYVSAHQVARKFQHAEALELLLERSPADVKLLDACWDGDESAVLELLMENQALASSLTESDRRHTAHAARNNELIPLRLMLKAGFPVDSTSQHNATPLHWAAFQGNLEMVRTLLEYDPPLEVKDSDFNGTPLSWAMYGSEHGWHPESGDFAGVVTALLQAGARRPDKPFGTPEVQEALKAQPK